MGNRKQENLFYYRKCDIFYSCNAELSAIMAKCVISLLDEMRPINSAFLESKEENVSFCFSSHSQACLLPSYFYLVSVRVIAGLKHLFVLQE